MDGSSFVLVLTDPIQMTTFSIFTMTLNGQLQELRALYAEQNDQQEQEQVPTHHNPKSTILTMILTTNPHHNPHHYRRSMRRPPEGTAVALSLALARLARLALALAPHGCVCRLYRRSALDLGLGLDLPAASQGSSS